jgi:hypothetical protein
MTVRRCFDCDQDHIFLIIADDEARRDPLDRPRRWETAINALGTALFLLAVSTLQHAIPTHIRPQVRDLALRGLVAMMVAVKLTTLLRWRRADDDHKNEGCGINHGDLFFFRPRSATLSDGV